jgi:broad specificity phosphatase PhoE
MKMFDALLTEKGRADAFALGTALAGARPVMLHHSPVVRGRETAEMIAAGIADAGGSAGVRGETAEIRC